VVYIRSEANLADAPSRQRGLDMWSLQLPTQQELLHLVESTLGSQVCTDPFACRQSAVAPKFATPLHCRHSAVFNGLLLDWSPPVTLWVNPPWHLLPQVLGKLRASRAKVFFLSSPTGLFSHGFKKCSGCPPSTSACHLLVTVSDRTTLASSSPSSIERCVCGQWSSTVCNR